MKSDKLIQSIKIERMEDSDPDTSYLGEYSATKSEHGIDRKHSIDCPCNSFWEDSPECNCDESGPYSRKEYQFFNPAQDYRECEPEDQFLNTVRDYERMESLQRGDWYYIGIRAQAEIVIDGTCQTITSGGLWGIESDSDESYLKKIEQEELSELRSILHTMGFSKRAIACAVKEAE
jgi:hypothetical protein